jgi:Flp pilus assembly protein TadG
MSTHSSKRRPRRGAALVELAICLPLIVLITLATIEANSMLYLKQGLKIAAFEGCRVGLVPNAISGNVEGQVAVILDGRRIVGYTIATSPADVSALNRGDFFRVTVSAACSSNSLFGSWFYAGQTFSEAVEMVKDR